MFKADRLAGSISRILLPVGLALGLLPAWTAPAVAQADPRAIVARAIAAHGGEAKLGQLNAEQAKTRGTVHLDGKTIPFTAETFVQLPSQFKNVMTYELQGKKGSLTQVLDGDKGWLSFDGNTKPLEEPLLSETRETMYAQRIARLLSLLKDKDIRLAGLPEVKVNDQPAVGVKVSTNGHKEISLYFDKASGLLVKIERRALNSEPKKEVRQEEFFSDFKEVNGVKRPMKIMVLQDGVKFLEGEMTEVKPTEKLPENIFAKP